MCDSEFLCFQDVDSAYLVKADLEDKVGALTDEINFLRSVYEEVLSFVLHILSASCVPTFPPSAFG